MTPQDISILILIVALLIAVIIDLFTHKIPNWLTLSTLLIGLSSQSIANGFLGFLIGAGGSVTGLCCLILFYASGGMGAGDVKLMAAVGSFIGIKLTFFASAFTLAFGGILALLILLSSPNSSLFIKRQVQILRVFFSTKQLVHIAPEEKDPGKKRFPYALAISAGTATTLYKFGLLKGFQNLIS